MNYELRTNKGMTLTETTIVVGVMALLTALSLPAVRTFFSSMATAGNTRSLISAALSSARAIAAKEQRYAGIRFQKAYDPRGVLDAPQYMIFIVYEEPKNMNNLTVGFRAIEGIQPIRLSDEVGVMDLNLGSTSPNQVVDNDSKINDSWELTDTTAFSIIFSPSGKLVVHNVRVRNRNGEQDSTANNGNTSNDDIFNKKAQVDSGIGMFYQDDYCGGSLNIYPNLGLWEEPSRNSFIIYDKTEFNKIDINKRWTNCLAQLAQKRIYISPYTGTIVNSGQ